MKTYQITAIRNAFKRRKELKQGIFGLNIANELWIACLSYESGLTVQFIKDNLEIIKDL